MAKWLRFGAGMLSLYYFLFYAFHGSYLPIINLFFEKELYFTGTQIGLLFSINYVLTTISPPFLGGVSDTLHRPRTVIAACLLLSSIALVLFARLMIFWQVVIVMVLFSFFNSPLFPLIDSLALGYAGKTGVGFGRMRAWGSVGFIAAALFLGVLFAHKPDLTLAFWFAATASVLALMLVPLLPEVPVQRMGNVGRRAIAVFRQPDVLVLTLCAVLGNVAMMAYYTFFSNYLFHMAFYDKWVAPVWAIGAVAEIPFIFHADSIIARLGVRTVFAIGLGAVATRMFLLSLKPPVWLILASQLLHPFTYAAIAICGMIYLNTRCPADLRGSAQSIFGAAFMGAGGIIGSMIGGWFIDAYDVWQMMLAHGTIAGIGMILFLLFFRAHENSASAQ